MTATTRRTLSPIIRDRAGAVEPILAAIAAITGQPLTAVVHMLSQSIAALKGISGVQGEVSPEDASHAALHRFGYEPHRLYADQRPHPVVGEITPVGWPYWNLHRAPGMGKVGREASPRRR